MKTLKNIFLLVLLFSAVKLSAQTDKATTARIVDAQNYIFVATQAYPLNAADINKVMNKMSGYTGGGTINLTGSNYDLAITRDSVVAYLPYYGRSYTPRLGSIDDTGIKFKSKDFNYKITARKKGGWQVTMNPKGKEIKDNYSLTLLITENGYGTLTINSNNQQTITFNGYIDEPKPKKEKAG
jgi:beta-glucosidase/6-phospho-beta-glucosidase/beta-galactosidase